MARTGADTFGLHLRSGRAQIGGREKCRTMKRFFFGTRWPIRPGRGDRRTMRRLFFGTRGEVSIQGADHGLPHRQPRLTVR